MKIRWFRSTTFWNSVLVIAIVISVFIIPVLGGMWGKNLVRPGLTVIYFSALFSLEKRPSYILMISVATFLLEWISGVFDLTVLQLLARSMNVVYFILVVLMLIRQMAKAKIVNARVILGSISGYLLIAMIFGMVIAAIMVKDPGAYYFSQLLAGTPDPNYHLSDSLYYGIVTMATVGYGDIVPVKPYTRSLATIISIAGQLYIAIIIALLVGKFAVQNQVESSDQE